MTSKTCFLVSFFWMLASAQAAVITGGDFGHTSTPLDDPGWNRVGRVGTNGSGVYLGNGWVLTANHVSTKTTFVVKDDATYSVLPGSENTYRIRNPANTQDVDLYMFRVGVAPGNGLHGLPLLYISTSLAPNNTDGTHIGTGKGQTSTSFTTYYVDTSPATWVWNTANFAGADTLFGGYTWAGDPSRDTRWNTQRMLDNNWDFSNMEGFLTEFRNVDGYGMAADNDSGSPIFFKNGSNWELSGIAISVARFSGQPGSTGVWGNGSVYADLSAYRDQILPIVIPELGTLSLAAILLFAWMILHKKNYRKT